MTRARNTTDVHLQRKPPEKLRAGSLHSIQDSATSFGRIRLPTSSPQASTASTQKPIPWCSQTMHGPYLCPELAPYAGRPGAMDAFTKPSRMGNTLFYRDGHTESAT